MTRAQRGMERGTWGANELLPKRMVARALPRDKSVRPIRTGPDSTMRRKALIVRSLAPKPANRGSNLVKF